MNFDETKYKRIDHSDGRVEFVPIVDEAKDTYAHGDKYYGINGEGESFPTTWVCDQGDRSSLAFHNIFPTAAQADKAAEYMRFSNAIIRACLLEDPDFVPDWSDEDQPKYYFYLSSEGWGICCAYEFNTGCAVVSSEEKAKAVIKRLEKWGVK